MNNDTILELRNIVKIFPGVRALDGISFSARAGRVHVIVGENGAGKSTMMKVINGEYVPEEGEVILKGEKLGKRTIQESIQLGISMVHQELTPISVMDIAENMFIGRQPTKVKGIVDFHKMHKLTQDVLDEMKIPYKSDKKMGTLTLAGQQLVEIAKAVSRNSSVIILDEPTSSITDEEVEVLFEQIEKLKQRGVAILYITHKMDEIMRIADDITVMRDGQMIETGSADNFTIDKIISLMVGREVNDLFPKKESKIGDTILEVKNLSKAGLYRDISFSLKRGEILGFAGLVGAGRSEVMRAIFGLEPADSGEIWLDGELIKPKNTKESIKKGIAMVTEDRRGEGIFPDTAVKDNLTIASIKKYANCNVVNEKKELKAANSMIDAMSIKVASMGQPIRNLSGGNQQKVILGRWMLMDLKVLIFDEPTRGIDIGSKEEVHQIMTRFAEKGYGIIMISSELPEIIGMSDRVIVMHEGRKKGELLRGEATQESVMRYATE